MQNIRLSKYIIGFNIVKQIYTHTHNNAYPNECSHKMNYFNKYLLTFHNMQALFYTLEIIFPNYK